MTDIDLFSGTERKIVRSEDSEPIEATICAFVCRHCRSCHFDKQAAVDCCANDYPCKCGQRMKKFYSYCDKCRSDKKHREWFAKDFSDWDMCFPVASWATDEFFWNADDLAEEILYAMDCELDMDGENVSLAAIEAFCAMRMLCTCDKEPPPAFDVNEFLTDHLTEDDFVADADEINEAVDKLIADAGVGPTYYANGGRIDPKHVALAIGFDIKEAGQ